MMCASLTLRRRAESRVCQRDLGLGDCPAGMRLTMRYGSDRFSIVGAPHLRVVPPVDFQPAPIPFEPFGPPPAHAPRGLDLAEARSTFDQGRFWTEYQAIVHARTGKTCAFEALGRFRRRDGHLIPPTRMFAVLHADPSLLLRTEP